MKKFILLFGIIIVFGISSASSKSLPAPKVDQCYTCHKDVGGEPAELFANDIHHEKGITCAGCHGGNDNSDDMDVAMSEKSGYLGVPKGDEISERCAKCHANEKIMKSYGSNLPTNQFANLKNSVHGNLATNGKERIVQCITCHNAHGIKRITDPKSPVYPLNVPKLCSSCHSNAVFMRAYNPGLPVDQYQKYLTSVHGTKNAKGDPKPAECVSCHGSHDIQPVKDVKSKVYPTNIPYTCAHCHQDKDYMKPYNIPTDQFENYSKSVHGIALLQKNDLGAPACNSCHGNHGAVPPGVTSISEVCGTCHALNAQLFSQSPHKEAFDKKGYPECETCHGNHDIVTPTNKMLGVTDGAVCIRCHKKNDKGYQASKIMRAMLDSLDAAQSDAQKLIDEAEQKGMEVSDAKYNLRGANQAKIEAKTTVHSFNLKKFEDVINKKGFSVTNEVIADAQKAIHDYYFRRIGLAISVAIISLLCIGLFLYIKRLDKNKTA